MISPTLIKSLTESAITSINGPIMDLEIKKIEEKSDHLIMVKGEFRIAFGAKKYSFVTELDEKGNVKSYERLDIMTFG